MDISAVGRTAFSVARVRALESDRPDALFQDPYAAAFAAALAPTDGASASADRRALAFHVVIRTRFYDDYLLRAVADGCRQVVLLGAGLDTRAFRLAWPAGVRLFELDRAEVLAVKEDLLGRAEPSCDRATVAADLAGDWLPTVHDAGFDPTKPTAWLVEGVLAYLSAGTARHVLRASADASAGGSTIAFERPKSARRRLTASDVQDTAGLWQDGLPVDELDRLRECGWDVREHLLGDVAATYGRPMSRVSDSGFVTVHRAAS